MTLASEYEGGGHAHQIYLEGAAAAVDALSALPLKSSGRKAT